MTFDPLAPGLPFDLWDAHDALDALHLAGLRIDHVEQARWPASAPQPRTHRQAYTFRTDDATDPHLLLVFEAPEDLDVWRLWLARYWKARPYLSIKDNLLLLVSRDLPEHVAARFHEALARLQAAPSAPMPTAAASPVAESASLMFPDIREG